VHGEFQNSSAFLRVPRSCQDCAVRDLTILFLHLPGDIAGLVSKLLTNESW